MPTSELGLAGCETLIDEREDGMIISSTHPLTGMNSRRSDGRLVSLSTPCPTNDILISWLRVLDEVILQYNNTEV